MIFILSQYKVLSFNIGYLFLQAIAFLALIISLRTIEFRFEKTFFIFNLSIFISVLLSLAIHGSIFNGTFFYYANGVTLIFIIGILSKYVNISKLYKWYAFLGIFITSVVVLQSMYIIISGENVSPIKLFPTPPESERLWQAASRPSGFFTEPQLYASFILPLFLLSFLKKHNILCFILAVGILASGSTYGLIILCFLTLWLVNTNIKVTSTKAWFTTSISIFLLLSLFIFTSLFDITIYKLLDTNFFETIRVGKSPILYFEMSTIEKLLGMQGSVENFIIENIASFPWLLRYLESDSRLLYYVTGLFGLGIYYGIVPMILFLFMLLNVYIHGDKFQKGLSIILFLHSISATFLFNSYFLFFFLLMFAASFDGSSTIKYWKLKL